MTRLTEKALVLRALAGRSFGRCDRPGSRIALAPAWPPTRRLPQIAFRSLAVLVGLTHRIPPGQPAHALPVMHGVAALVVVAALPAGPGNSRPVPLRM